MRYKTGIAMNNMTRWMRFALDCLEYYKRKKRKQYHQETKSTVQCVLYRWYQQGRS